MPEIAIITPVKNGANYIADCIKSVKEQTYTDIEHFIMISSDTTDNTRQICEELSYPGLHIIDGGEHIDTRIKQAISYTNAKYISILAHDDMLRPTFCEKMLLTLISNNADFAYSNYYVADLITKQISEGHPMDFTGLAGLFRCNHLGIFWLFKKELYSLTDVSMCKLGESWDYLFTLQLAARFINFVRNTEALATWRIHSTSDSGKGTDFIIQSGENARRLFDIWRKNG